tara:strand:- start:55 stop:1533 length:1479 start_codon:yes stop_codon:yes gene_type:complete
MAKEYFSLSRTKILNKARPYPKFRNMMVDILKNAPMKKAGFIGDENWNGKGTWMIKVSDVNFKHIVKTLGKGKETKRAMTYELPSGKVSGGKTVPISVRFRESGKIEAAKAGTAEQEQGSAYIFDRVVNKNIDYKSWEDIVADEEAYDELVKIFRGDVPDSWLMSYYAQQKVLLKKVQPAKMSKFDHSGAKSFMDFITNLCLKNFNKQLSLGGKKDSWNPADIWIVNGNQTKIKQELEKSVTTIHELNSVLRQMYYDKRVMGISLKKTGKVAYYEEVNLDESNLIPNTKDYNFPAPMKAFTANFKISAGDDMFTQDVKISIDGGGKTFVFQIKANSSDAKGGSNLKFEPTAKGSGTARLGKAPVDKVTKILKDEFSRTFVNDYNKYPGYLNQFETHAKGEKYFRDVLSDLLPQITTDMKNVDDVINNIKASFGGTKDRGTNTRAKLMGLDFFYQIFKLDDDDRREFITDMIFLAQKKAFSKVDYFGPFGKIY